MAKKKDHKEVEHLRGLNRQLLKKVKQLQKQVGRSEKEANKKIAEYTNFVEPSIEEEPIASKLKCSNCGSYKVKSIDMKIKTVIECSECNHREAKKGQKK